MSKVFRKNETVIDWIAIHRKGKDEHDEIVGQGRLLLHDADQAERVALHQIITQNDGIDVTNVEVLTSFPF